MLDLMLRTGPYGDALRHRPRRPDPRRARGQPARRRPRPARAAPARGAAHAVAARSSWRPSRSSPTSTACAPALDAAAERRHGADRPARTCARTTPGCTTSVLVKGKRPLHAAGAPGRRRAARPRRRRARRWCARAAGAVEAPVEVTDAIMPGVVVASRTAGATTGPARAWRSPRARRREQQHARRRAARRPAVGQRGAERHPRRDRRPSAESLSDRLEAISVDSPQLRQITFAVSDIRAIVEWAPQLGHSERSSKR